MSGLQLLFRKWWVIAPPLIGENVALHAATTARSPLCRMPTSPEVRGGERLLKTCSSACKAPSKSGAEHG